MLLFSIEDQMLFLNLTIGLKDKLIIKFDKEN